MKTQLVTTAALALCVSAAGTVFDFEKDLGGGRYDRRYAKLNTATPALWRSTPGRAAASGTRRGACRRES